MSPVPELPDIRDPLKQLPAESVLSELLLSGSAVPALSKLLLSVPPVPALSELLLSAPPCTGSVHCFFCSNRSVADVSDCCAPQYGQNFVAVKEFLDNTLIQFIFLPRSHSICILFHFNNNTTVRAKKSPKNTFFCFFYIFHISWLSPLLPFLPNDPVFRRTGRSALYKTPARITEITAFTKVVAALHFARTSAICCGCPIIYCL